MSFKFFNFFSKNLHFFLILTIPLEAFSSSVQENQNYIFSDWFNTTIQWQPVDILISIFWK